MTQRLHLFQASAGVSRAFLTPYSNRLSINKNKFIYSVDRPQLETGQNLTAIFVLLCYHMHPAKYCDRLVMIFNSPTRSQRVAKHKLLALADKSICLQKNYFLESL